MTQKMEVKYITPQIKSIKYSISINTVCIGWIRLGKKIIRSREVLLRLLEINGNA